MAHSRSDPAAALVGAYVDLYPAEAARLLEAAPVHEVVEFLGRQDATRAAAVLQRLSAHLAAQCLPRLDADVRTQLLAALEPARAASLLSRLEPGTHAEIVATLDASLARELQELASYPPDTAGQLMDTRVPTFEARLSVRETVAKVRSARRLATDGLIVVGQEGELVGVVSALEVMVARPDQSLGSLVTRPPPAVSGMAPREEVADLLTARDLRVLPVVDARGYVLGAIRQQALVQALQEQATADLTTMVGAGREERALSSPFLAVRKRLPWLNINLLTAFLAASVVGVFEDTIAQFTALAVLLPVVAGQSGNTGAQALAVVMRGLALREIRARHWVPVVLKESLAGTLNGVGIALVTAAGVYVWSGSWGLCAVIGVAMVLSMIIAGVSGAAIPMLLTWLRQDPAQSASIILTTVTDVMGFLSFLGLATLFAALL